MKTFRGPEASWWQADRRETVCLADRELFLMLQQEPRVPPLLCIVPGTQVGGPGSDWT